MKGEPWDLGQGTTNDCQESIRESFEKLDEVLSKHDKDWKDKTGLVWVQAHDGTSDWILKEDEDEFRKWGAELIRRRYAEDLIGEELIGRRDAERIGEGVKEFETISYTALSAASPAETATPLAINPTNKPKANLSQSKPQGVISWLVGWVSGKPKKPKSKEVRM